MKDFDTFLKTGYNYIKLQDPKIALEINKFQRDLEKSRDKEVQCIINFVNEICRNLETAKSDVYRVVAKKTEPLSLRAKMVSLEEKISKAKIMIREELMSTMEKEEELMKELRLLEGKTKDWMKTTDTTIVPTASKTSIYKISCQDAEQTNPTTELQKFLIESGGRYGGWLEQDHLFFLRERRKHKKKDKFFMAVHNILPDMSFDEIEQHENWFLKYENLRSAQKEAIHKWKQQKQQSKILDKEKENSEIKKKIKSVKKSAHQVNMAERIKEWRSQQQAKKLEESERQAQEKKQLELERKKLNKINQMKKIAVDQYKAEKQNKILAELLMQKERPSTKEDKTKNKILMESFRSQDNKFIEKKKIIRLQMETKALNKIERLKLAKCQFDFLLQRDPQRIFKPTLIWTQHCQPKNENDKLNNVFNLSNIPHLAIPEWRKELKFN